MDDEIVLWRRLPIGDPTSEHRFKVTGTECALRIRRGPGGYTFELTAGEQPAGAGRTLQAGDVKNYCAACGAPKGERQLDCWVCGRSIR